jgi:apolipoprotein N-acyltransferase
MAPFGFRLPLVLALITSAVAGVALRAAFPAPSLWPLIFLALPLLLWSLAGRGFAGGLLVGLVAGLGFWLTLINWLTLYLGPVPWLALAVLQAILFSLPCGFVAWMLTAGSSFFDRPWRRWVLLPVLVGSLWTGRELLSGSWPYGGFAWGRLSQAFADAPGAALVSWLGMAGLSFVIAVLATALFVALTSAARIRSALGVLVVGCLLALVPPSPTVMTGSMNILAVQGNSKAGLFDVREPGEVLRDHVNATLPQQGNPIDLVVWPENASDPSPLTSSLAAMTLNYVSTTVNAPILTGAITTNPKGNLYNSSLLWSAGRGVVAQYDKIHPVPFAEYMPNREIWRAFAPDLVDLVTRDYSFGERPNVISVDERSLGVSICFDIVDDAQIDAMISRGAQIIIAQTNNADFGRTDESVQQLAIARMRARETGRAVVNISTVGASAIFRPDGSTQSHIPSHEVGTMREAVPTASGNTWAMQLAVPIRIGLSVLCLSSVVVALGIRLRSGRGTKLG